MKRLITVLAVLALLACPVALAEDEYTQGLIADMQAVETLTADAEARIHDYEPILHGATLDHVTINPNYGTDESGDFIALVYMEYAAMSDAKTDVNTLVLVSNNIASAIIDSCPGAVELAVFWELPAYDSQAKIAYTIDKGGYHYGDAMLPKVLAEAWG